MSAGPRSFKSDSHMVPILILPLGPSRLFLTCRKWSLFDYKYTWNKTSPRPCCVTLVSDVLVVADVAVRLIRAHFLAVFTPTFLEDTAFSRLLSFSAVQLLFPLMLLPTCLPEVFMFGSHHVLEPNSEGCLKERRCSECKGRRTESGDLLYQIKQTIKIIILDDCDALLVPNDNECGQIVAALQPVVLKRLFTLLSPLTLLGLRDTPQHCSHSALTKGHVRADCDKCPPCLLEQGKW